MRTNMLRVCALATAGRSGASALVALLAALAPLAPSATASDAARADDPVAFGRLRLDTALPGAADKVEVAVTGLGDRESFRLTTKGRGARIDAADAAGAMYGLLELAERARREGESALRPADFAATPFLRDRGLNLFLTLPWDYEKNDSDYDPAALTDPKRWWFANDGFWSTLLDQMAESRLNWLDLHGTWDVSVTDAPNLYAYFIQSDAYPEVGVAAGIKAKNLERLNRVIDMAHARGVRVSLMAYEARLSTPHRRSPPYPNDEETAYAYTRDVVEKMIRGAPGLDAIGFRIGESGHGGDFFRCYGEAVAASGRDIPLYTRSWITRKEKVVPLARASSDFTVEIKYDGEQWGTPWPFAGGRVPAWYSYSFEDYLSDSGDGEAKHVWPGNLAPDGSRWPFEPYKIVWQVRANGTHRIFPFFAPDWVRRTIEPMRMGSASGFTIEPQDAYYPKSPRYYVADPATLPCEWTHERDDLYLMQWGRLGYDPRTSDAVFDQALRERFGAAAEPLSRAWRAASHVVPLALMAHAIGPDHRDHAPELEWGGGTRDWIEGEGLDSHVFLPIRDEIALRTTGGHDGRVSVLEVAAELESLAAKIDQSLPAITKAVLPPAAFARVGELVAVVSQLASLARYDAARFRSAWWSALADSEPSQAGSRRSAADAMEAARAAWQKLSESPAAKFYKPFSERLRMHTNTFHWRDQLAAVTAEAEALKKAAGNAPAAAPAPASAPAANPAAAAAAERPAETVKLSWREEKAGVTATLPARGVTRAWLLVKPLPSATFFHSVAMERRGEAFTATFPREKFGHLIAAEIETKAGVRRIPDWREGPPWLVVPSQSGPTPLIYSSEEALAHLDPAVLTPEKYGTLVIAPRAWNFFRSFDPAAQRKLLDAVSRGMTLLVLQQDYTSGRYRLNWLPQPPKVENFRADSINPGGALGLEVVRAPDVIFQRFAAQGDASPWKVEGDGALVHQKLGKGEIWMVQARLTQNLHHPGCARALQKLLRSGGVDRPLVLIDPGSEGGRYASAVIPDFLNARDLPFLVLGEVVAREQGVKAAAVVPGRPWDDFVLGGKGPGMVRAFVDAQSKAMAAKPAPATREEFEAQRAAQKAKVMQSLGLDPLPERTPLNARITAVLERDGYRIEKVVFESRPGFPVTGHLYVPTNDAAKAAANPAGKLPVILNPHGHWSHKKSEPVVQQRMIQQALHGYLAMIVDSPGFSFEGDNLIERREEGTHDDFRYTLSSSNTTGFYVWDQMRALDWLATRPEADMSRVGLTGASGGGLATLWEFAADDRIHAAVPVCFATSLEVMPDNGCLCNHVPGTLRIGDRADAMAVRAPAPVLIIGADDDREFPPEGSRKTGEKLTRIWSLFGAESHVATRIFHSQHDYNLEMVAAALGFFDKELRGVGDGSPVTLTARPTEPADSREMLCLDNVQVGPPAFIKTMRELAVARLAAAPPVHGDAAAQIASFVALNGGVPQVECGPLVAKDASGKDLSLPKSPAEVGKGGASRSWVTFESAKGLTVPGILWLPAKAPRAGVVLIHDEGKAVAATRMQVDKLVDGGFACLAIDPRGIGELSPIDLRLLEYQCTAPAFAAALDVAHAVALLTPIAGRVGVAADGAVASLAALDAALIEPKLLFVTGRDSIKEFADAFDESVPLGALQPMADRAPKLSQLRAALSIPAEWHGKGEGERDLFSILLKLLERQ